MAGTKAGAMKSRDKNLQKDPNFYASIGSKSWSNPERSRDTGFANIPREKHIELSSKGGKKTKSDYKTKNVNIQEDYLTPEEFHEIVKDQDSDDSGIS